MERGFQFTRRPAFWVHGLGAVVLGGSVAVRMGLPDFILWATIGILLWTFMEYGLHRFVFHLDSQHPTIARTLDGLHRAHHREPLEADRLFVRMSFSVPISILVFLPLWALTGDLPGAVAILSGLWLGFVYYEWVHAAVHLRANSRWLRKSQRDRHLRHHFRDSSADFGVTSELWDKVFRTAARSRP